MIKLILLRYVARNIQSIVDFMIDLDKTFDAYLSKQEAELVRLDTAKERMEADYLERISDIDAQRAVVIRDANLAGSLKGALPKPPM
jgi:hypothetical protein